MKISLHQLNQSWQALARLASKEFPKDQHKTAYRIARIYKQAKGEMETLGESLTALMDRCGFRQSDSDVDPAKIADYNEQSKKFLKETEFEFTWGQPIRFEELRDHVSLTPADLAELDWLIVEEEEKSKTAVV